MSKLSDDRAKKIMSAEYLLLRTYQQYEEIGSQGAVDIHKRYDKSDRNDPLGEVIEDYYDRASEIFDDV